MDDRDGGAAHDGPAGPDHPLGSPVSVPDGREEAPPLGAVAPYFRVYDRRRHGDRILLVGEPLVPPETLERRLWSTFREAGYEITYAQRRGEHYLLVEPANTRIQGVPWTNVVLFLATVVSTLFVGAVWWYYVDPATIAGNPQAVLVAWPFTVAVMGVLGIHELGHYVMSRYHGVRASLPYFIPVPTIIGTMGAVIRMKGRMPDRKALFDIGVAGPLAGLVATIVVTAIGLTLPPVTVPPEVLANADGSFRLADPPLLEAIAWAIGADLSYEAANRTVNPVVIGGWVGMFVTFLNLIPVGQLDGGHMLRAMLGKRTETVGAAVPAVLFGLSGYLYYWRGLDLGDSVMLWAVWGGFATLLALNGPVDPIDEGELGWRRQAIGLLTFALGLACFTLVPFEVIT